MTKTKPICSYCGSPNVMGDAYATWNIKKQEWECNRVFDKGAVCGDCDGECSLEWINVEHVHDEFCNTKSCKVLAEINEAEVL